MVEQIACLLRAAYAQQHAPLAAQVLAHDDLFGAGCHVGGRINLDDGSLDDLDGERNRGEGAVHLDAVLARGLAYDRDEISDLVEKGGRISRELDHRLDLGAEAIEVPQLAGRRGALCHHPGGASAVVLNEGEQHVEECLVIRDRVAHGDARIEEGELHVGRVACRSFGDEDVPRVQIAMHEIVEKDHLEDCIDAIGADAPTLRGATWQLRRPFEKGASMHKTLDEHLARHEGCHRLGEGH